MKITNAADNDKDDSHINTYIYIQYAMNPICNITIILSSGLITPL